MPALAAAVLLAACAHYPVNARLERHDPGYGYRFANLRDGDNSDSLLLVLTFSGGGTRAAAFAYGVLEQLSATQIDWEGRRKRLLDEVDMIFAVSGGSYTAAYYALHRDRTFHDFPREFLERDVQGELARKMLVPFNLLRAAGPTFGRIDLVAEYLDRELFRGATYGDLVKAGRRPFVLINASDMSLGARFEFTQDRFDLLCSDLSRFPLARAVAASSAVPVVFSPLTLWNYAGGCGYAEPDWVGAALADRAGSARRFNQAAELRAYGDAEARPYIHLLDGGITDNLGLRGLLDRVIAHEGPAGLACALGMRTIRKAVLVTVSAEIGPDLSWDRSPAVPTASQVIRAVTNIPISRYSFESLELLRSGFAGWARQMRERGPGGAGGDFDFYLVEVSFDRIADEAEREALRAIPTSFVLPPATVARLRRAAAEVVTWSPEFQRLLRDLAADRAQRAPRAPDRPG